MDSTYDSSSPFTTTYASASTPSPSNNNNETVIGGWGGMFPQHQIYYTPPVGAEIDQRWDL